MVDIEEVNTTRAALYGKLATKAAEARLPLDWPGRFFRKSTRARNGAADDSNKPESEKAKT